MPDLVLPVLNESLALPWVLSRVPDGYRAIVVDNGSSDDSAAVAAGLAALVVVEPRRGFGSACAAGLAAATAETVCFMDADGSLDPAELPIVAGPVEAGQADLVMGARAPTSWRAWPPHARLGNRLLAHRVSRMTSTKLTDLGPMRAARRLALIGLGIEDIRFGWPLEMVMRAAANGWRIEEVAVGYRPRAGGSSKVTGTVLGTARTVRDMRAVLRACT